MHKIQVPAQIINIIISYLADRRIYVVVNGICSTTKTVRAGVPQGSILGPTLYSIFTNDIPTTRNTQLAIYADDTAIYASSWNPQQATKYIQHHLNQITEYMSN